MAGSNEVLLVRHGETDDNAGDRFQGRTDTRLNERGREQSRALARRLRGEGLRALYCSPLRRAHETARIVGAQLGLEACRRAPHGGRRRRLDRARSPTSSPPSARPTRAGAPSTRRFASPAASRSPSRRARRRRARRHRRRAAAGARRHARRLDPRRRRRAACTGRETVGNCEVVRLTASAAAAAARRMTAIARIGFAVLIGATFAAFFVAQELKSTPPRVQDLSRRRSSRPTRTAARSARGCRFASSAPTT